MDSWVLFGPLIPYGKCFALLFSLSFRETTSNLTFVTFIPPHGVVCVHRRNGKLSDRFLEGNPGAAVLDFGGSAVDSPGDPVPAENLGVDLWENDDLQYELGGRFWRTVLITHPDSADLRAAGVTERDLHLFVEQVTGINPFFVSMPTQDDLPAYINFRSHRDMRIASQIISHNMRIVVSGRHFCDINVTQVK